MWTETANMLWCLSECVLLCWFIPVNPHFITCCCLQRVFLVFLNYLLKHMVYVDVILLLLLTQYMEHSLHGNLTHSDCLSEWFDVTNEILSMLVTSWIIILLSWKIGSFTQGTFFNMFCCWWISWTFDNLTEFTPILRWKPIWKAQIFHIVSLEASLNSWKVTVTFFSNLK
jgi:hypothetical protein